MRKKGWISINERMPEKGQRVLVNVDFNSEIVTPLVCSARWTGSTFSRGEVSVAPGDLPCNVTHWMELPESPTIRGRKSA